MNLFGDTIAQLRGVFESMTPGARVTAGLLVAVVVVSLGFLFQTVSAGPDAYLFGGEAIARDQLVRIEGALAQAGINDFEVDGNRVRVPRAGKAAALAAIAAAGELPQGVDALMDDGINGGSLLEFSDAKRRRYHAARERQAARILSEHKWVDEAYVVFNEQEQPGLRATRQATAAVSLRPAVGEALDRRRVRQVKDFVGRSFAIQPEDIVVTNLNGGAVSGGDGVEADDFDDPYYKIKLTVESDLRQSILDQLVEIRGVGVQVNAQIDPTAAKQVVSVAPNGDGVQIAASTREEKRNQVNGPPGSRVGVEANGPATLAGRDDTLSREEQTTSSVRDQDKKYALGVEKTTTTTAGYTVRSAEASIMVPNSHVLEVYKLRNAGRDGEPPEEIDPNVLAQLKDELKNTIETLVKPIMPRLSVGENEYRQVNVGFIDALPKPTPAPPSATENALTLLGDHGNTLAMAGLTVFSLLMLRSMVSSSGSTEPTGGLPSLELDGEPLDDADDEADSDRPRLKLRKADSVKDDLSEMVGSDPDAAAAILKSWINNAAG